MNEEERKALETCIKTAETALIQAVHAKAAVSCLTQAIGNTIALACSGNKNPEIMMQTSLNFLDEAVLGSTNALQEELGMSYYVREIVAELRTAAENYSSALKAGSR